LLSIVAEVIDDTDDVNQGRHLIMVMPGTMVAGSVSDMCQASRGFRFPTYTGHERGA
jgi:hypothetical protein